MTLQAERTAPDVSATPKILDEPGNHWPAPPNWVFWHVRAEEVRLRLSVVEGTAQDANRSRSQTMTELEAAKEMLADPPKWWWKRWRQGRFVIANAIGHIHGAELALILTQSEPQLRARLPEFMQVARESLPATDLRRKALEELNDKCRQVEPWGGTEGHNGNNTGKHGSRAREVIYDAMAVSYTEFERRQMQVPRFADATLIGSLILGVLTLLTILVGLLRPDIVPLCFKPEGHAQVCPTGSIPHAVDHAVICFAGLTGATLAAVATLPRLRSARTLYPAIALLLLKLVGGALTATLGILLMSAQFVPGLTALDSSAQIIGWAVLFGYSQQLFTTLADRHASGLVTSAERSYQPSQDGGRHPG